MILIIVDNRFQELHFRKCFSFVEFNCVDVLTHSNLFFFIITEFILIETISCPGAQRIDSDATA